MRKVDPRYNTVQTMEGETVDQTSSRSFWFAEINTGHHSGAAFEMATPCGSNG